MNLLKQTKELCKIYEIHPARSKGQNFLIKEDIYQQIIESADLQKNDTVLEVGPGLGFLTTKLAEKVKQVVAVELDDKLAEILRVKLEKKGVENVEVINEDILKIANNIILSVIASETKPTGEVKRGNPVKNALSDGIATSSSFASLRQTPRNDIKYKVVANLPYNITSIFLRKFISEIEHKPKIMVLLLQKEVVERIMAKPGQMSLLTVSAQFYAKAAKIADVPASAFWPQPKVDSAIIALKIGRDVTLPRLDEKKFFRLVKIGFSSKRKQLQKNLSAGLHFEQNKIKEILKKNNLNEKVRAQELSLDDWHGLYVDFFGKIRQDKI